MDTSPGAISGCSATRSSSWSISTSSAATDTRTCASISRAGAE